MSASPANPLSSRKFKTALALHLSVLGVVVAWAAYRVQAIDERRALPPLRDEPLDVPPTYDYPVVVTDEQLVRVLRKIRPTLEGPDTRIGFTDHNLRCWTANATFDDPQFASGEELRAVLTDHRRFIELYGEGTPPLLLEVPGRGVRVRELEGAKSASHDDHTMACLAEVGTPLGFPIVTENRNTTFRALVEQSLRDFSINQPEYEWSALTYALFLPPTRAWVTSEGQQVSFDSLADRIMRERLPLGVCAGNHRLHTLVMFLRVHEQIPILSEEKAKQIAEFLQDVTAVLVKHQHPDGFWNRDWPVGVPVSRAPTEADGDTLSIRLISTGHALEWWALAPEEIHPPRPVLAAAGQWLVRTIDELSPEQMQQFISYLSHAGRALALWRGTTPDQVPLDE